MFKLRSNNFKRFIFFAAALSYGIGFGKFWKRYLLFKLTDMPEVISKIVFDLGLFVPMCIFGYLSIYYNQKYKEEKTTKKPPIQEFGLRSIWLGNGPLLNTVFSYLCTSTLMLLAATRLFPLNPSEITTSVVLRHYIVYTFCLSYYLFSVVGTWRSSQKYSGIEIYVWFARGAIAISISAVLISLFLNFTNKYF